MNFKQINLKHITGIIILGFAVGACNMGSSTDKIADTASTAAYSSPSPDSVQSTSPGNTVDSLMSATAADTNSAKTSASKTTSSNTTSGKKKGMAKVVMEPLLKNPKIAADKEGIYNYAEVSPSFSGGQNGIDNYINNNVEYPQTALDESKEGRIGVSFVVDENGKVTDAQEVGRKIGYGLDEEAIRVVSSMPKWTPGKVKGKPVKTRMTLPIVFQIQE